MDVEELMLDGRDEPLLPSIIQLEARPQGLIAHIGSQARTKKIELEGDGRTFIEYSKRYIGLPEEATRTWRAGEHTIDPVDAGALILKKIGQLVADAAETVNVRAVVTHPRDFTASRKQAVAAAARAAGIDLIETLNEPEAAFFMFHEPGEEVDPGLHVVFDLGGGTLDVALLRVHDGERPTVIGGKGDGQLGGMDWTRKLLDLVLQSAGHKLDMPDLADRLTDETYDDLVAKAKRLKEKQPKRHFSQLLRLKLENGREFAATVSVQRSSYEDACSGLVQRCLAAVEGALRDGGCRPEDVVRVYMVGGSSRLVSVQDALIERFGERVMTPRKADHDVDLAVAQGAARYAAWVVSRDLPDQRQLSVMDQTRLSVARQLAPVMAMPHGLNVLTYRGEEPYLETLVAKGAPLPAAETRHYQLDAVPSGGVKVELYEGPPGYLPPGIEPTATIDFEASAGLRVNDRLAVTTHVTESGRIEVVAQHEPSQAGRAATQASVLLNVGTAAEGGGEADQRRARIAAIEVR